MLSFAVAVLALASAVIAAPTDETHAIILNNNCGTGTALWNQASSDSPQSSTTAHAAVTGGEAWLNDGNCGIHGENCAAVEFTLDNGSVTIADISLAGSHANYTHPISFKFSQPCTQTLSCSSADCKDAIHDPTANGPYATCDQANAGIEITFC
ncbi:hypothetical protein CONPUDRAFT_124959 [Coniophora puteana RWD-64-598 SS2]|uniref:Glycopeptide n=1 Tax=Coniophora puteana (strain RWD-64-598) TaxID=741705 RepID=A0A5M3MMH3_CONPW|nr:uncharacterized protein CONPUDRAFT_124959 [Coniophora puteana RWD-64-598 SS2]EIW80236.1 hypothetical protein CONPUDRAFT_124959 [Coniophora puteana RWD-64-598 SS2]